VNQIFQVINTQILEWICVNESKILDYYFLTWIPKSILFSKTYQKEGKLKISIWTSLESDKRPLCLDHL